jgi:integrase
MLLETCYGCGLRVSELVSLRVSDIDGERRLLRIEQGKGAKDRHAIIAPSLLDRLCRYWWAPRLRHPSAGERIGGAPVAAIAWAQRPAIDTTLCPLGAERASRSCRPDRVPGLEPWIAPPRYRAPWSASSTQTRWNAK